MVRPGIPKRRAGQKSLVGLWLLTVLITEVPVLLSGSRDPVLLWMGGVVVLAPVLAQVTRNVLGADRELKVSLILASAALIVSACILASQLPKLALETNLDVTRAGSFEEVRLTLRHEGIDLAGDLGMSREDVAAARSARAVRGAMP